MSDPEDHVVDALADVLADLADWQHDAAKDAMRQALLRRVERACVELYGKPLTQCAAEDVWSMYTPFERAVWRALDDST